MRRLWIASVLTSCIAGLVVTAAQERGQSGQFRRLSVVSGQPELRDWDARITRMSRTGELVRRSVRRDTVLADGREHERYDQYINGVRVFGGDLVRQVRGGLTQSIHGGAFENLTINTAPSLSEASALERFARLTSQPLRAGARPELVVLALDTTRPTLTWRTHLWTAQGLMHTFIDAHTGAVVLQYNDLQSQAAVGSGVGVNGDRKKISTMSTTGSFTADDQLRPPVLITYDLKGNLSRAISLLNGLAPAAADVASDSDNDWTDGPNVDAHVHIGWTYDYLFKRFARRGLDDDDVAIRTISHPVPLSGAFSASPSTLGTFYANAFWCGPCGQTGEGMMVFGEGIPAGFTLGGVQYKPFAGALDVAAHELTHGLTDYSSGLIYQNESGALSEAFSDIIATSVEFFFQPAGSGPGRADYLLGEDVANPPIRSMANPMQFGDPDHYAIRFTGTGDNGGVHINSGIPNHAFYLAIEGGVNRVSGQQVQGVGSANREQIEKAFYRAFVFMLGSNATFSNARAATIQAARELYGANSAAEIAITQAWSAVGVS